MNRRSMREHVFKMIFSYEFDVEVEVETHVVNYLEEVNTKEDEDAYMLARVKSILESKEVLDKKIDEASEKWTVERMANVDAALLRLALYEIDMDEDIPTQVAINEAIELGRKYGGDASPKFINGILAKIVN